MVMMPKLLLLVLRDMIKTILHDLMTRENIFISGYSLLNSDDVNLFEKQIEPD